MMHRILTCGHVLTAGVCLLVGCQLANQASSPPAKSHTASIPPAPMPRAAAPSKTPPRNLKAKVAASQAAASQGTGNQPASSQDAGSQATSSQSAAPQDSTPPQTHTTFYRLDKLEAKIPPVMMTTGDAAMCRVKVGDTMPAIALPKLGGGGKTKLVDAYGKKATVVVIWKSDRRMTAQQLADMEPEVVEPFGKSGVAVIGVAVNETDSSAKAAVDKADAHFTNLLDADGKAFSQLGSGKLPRTYVLDGSGKILWFDIEYSLATRRELNQVLRATVSEK